MLTLLDGYRCVCAVLLTARGHSDDVQVTAWLHRSLGKLHWPCDNAVQFSSVQFKTASKCSGKHIRAPPRIWEVSHKSPDKLPWPFVDSVQFSSFQFKTASKSSGKHIRAPPRIWDKCPPPLPPCVAFLTRVVVGVERARDCETVHDSKFQTLRRTRRSVGWSWV